MFKSELTVPEIGKIVKHPSGRQVKIVRYSFFRNEFGIIEPFLYWREVLSDGKLSKKLECGKIWS